MFLLLNLNMKFPAGLTINFKSLWFYFTSTVSTQNRSSWLFFARPINVPKLKMKPKR